MVMLPRVCVALALAALFLTPACVVDPCAGIDDILDSPEGLRLVQDEHEAGWGNDACTQCHALETTHRANCTSEPDLDLEAVREEAEDGTYETCAGCHGANGVEESS